MFCEVKATKHCNAQKKSVFHSLKTHKMRAFAASLLELPPGGDDCEAGVVPDLHEVLAAGGSGPLLASRLPAS